MFNKEVVCNAASLFETRHPVLDFYVNVIVVYEVMPVVLGDDFFGMMLIESRIYSNLVSGVPY